MIRTATVRHLPGLIALLACVANSAVAQESDRTAALREVLRATVLFGYPWQHPSPTVVSAWTTEPCAAHGCLGADLSTPTRLPDSLQRFVRDSLHSGIIDPGRSAIWSCQVQQSPEMITLAEPGIHGDSAFVGVAWHGCVHTALAPSPVPRQVGHAILLLRRNAAGWKIAGMTQQAISLAPQEGSLASRSELERNPRERGDRAPDRIRQR